MRNRARIAVAGALVTAAAVTGTVALAGGGGGGPDVRERLTGYEEDPLVLSTTGRGVFEAEAGDKGASVDWSLSYTDLDGTVSQAHIHLGGRHQSGGIIVFLCSNLTTPAPPAGTQPCPQPTETSPATISGTFTADSVIGPAAQGIDPGEFAEFIRAVRRGVTYANLHTDKYPAGEIRAQLRLRRH